MDNLSHIITKLMLNNIYNKVIFRIRREKLKKIKHKENKLYLKN